MAVLVQLFSSQTIVVEDAITGEYSCLLVELEIQPELNQYQHLQGPDQSGRRQRTVSDAEETPPLQLVSPFDLSPPEAFENRTVSSRICASAYARRRWPEIVQPVKHSLGYTGQSRQRASSTGVNTSVFVAI